MSESFSLRRLFTVIPMLALAALFSCTAEPESTSPTSGQAPRETATSPQAARLSGQVLLPGEGGRRGVELHAWVATADGEIRQLWILPDNDGRFARNYSGVITRIIVFAGMEVHRIDPIDLPQADDKGQVNLGTIDLREVLVAFRVRIRAAEGAPSGVIRASLSIGPSHTGPRGELPSLGSKQFPSVELGSVVEWLLPPDTSDVHFLVERPDGTGRNTSWRSGTQRVFGPYDASAFPLELFMN